MSHKAYWFVVGEAGTGIKGYSSQSAAVARATELARENPGKTYTVARAVVEVTQPPAEIIRKHLEEPTP